MSACPAGIVIGIFEYHISPLPRVVLGSHPFDKFDTVAVDELRHPDFPIVRIGCACAVVLPLIIASSFLFKLASGFVKDMILLPISHRCDIVNLGM